MTDAPRRIALAGIGKIARDQHIPALEASGDWELAATISRNASLDGLPAFETMDDFLKAGTGIDTVTLALPPAPRFDYAAQALRAGLNVMLEKPPGRTMAECRRLEELAREAGVTLYASWHSRMGAATETAARRIADEGLKRLRIDWREDVREWHPGQDWVWEAGNLGVFDPGINAMSILVLVVDHPVFLTEARLEVPANRETPIGADLVFAHPDGAEITGRLDWRHEGEAVWDMWIETGAGAFALRHSGSRLEEDGKEVDVGPTEEYPLVYARFAELVRTGRSEVDLRPMMHVADAFLLGRKEEVAPFAW